MRCNKKIRLNERQTAHRFRSVFAGTHEADDWLHAAELAIGRQNRHIPLPLPTYEKKIDFYPYIMYSFGLLFDRSRGREKAVRAFQFLIERDVTSSVALFQEVKNEQNNYIHSVVLPYCFHHAMFWQCAEWAEAFGQERYASVANGYLQIPAGEMIFAEDTTKN